MILKCKMRPSWWILLATIASHINDLYKWVVVWEDLLCKSSISGCILSHIFHIHEFRCSQISVCKELCLVSFHNHDYHHYNCEKDQAVKHSRKLLCSKAEFESQSCLCPKCLSILKAATYFVQHVLFFFLLLLPSIVTLRCISAVAYHSFLIIFHWIDMLLFVYPFTCLWTFGLFLVWGYYP